MLVRKRSGRQLVDNKNTHGLSCFVWQVALLKDEGDTSFSSTRLDQIANKVYQGYFLKYSFKVGAGGRPEVLVVVTQFCDKKGKKTRFEKPLAVRSRLRPEAPAPSAVAFTVAGNVGCLVSDRVILSGPSHPERTKPSRGPSYLEAPLEIS